MFMITFYIIENDLYWPSIIRDCNGQGCKRSFHLSCVNPPLSYVPPGVWHCSWCTDRKIKFGLHSVSGGIESIWDVREVLSYNQGNRDVHTLLKNSVICCTFFHALFSCKDILMQVAIWQCVIRYAGAERIFGEV